MHGWVRHVVGWLSGSLDWQGKFAISRPAGPCDAVLLLKDLHLFFASDLLLLIRFLEIKHLFFKLILELMDFGLILTS